MDRQEYLVGRGEIYRSKDNDYRKKLRYSKLKDEYISSLESEVESLKAENATLREDNASLIEQFGAVGQKLDHALDCLGEFAPCPSLEVLKKECVATCKECWAAHLEEKCQN